MPTARRLKTFLLSTCAPQPHLHRQANELLDSFAIRKAEEVSSADEKAPRWGGASQGALVALVIVLFPESARRTEWRIGPWRRSTPYRRQRMQRTERHACGSAL